MNQDNESVVLKEDKAACYLGLARSTLRRGRMEGNRAKRMPMPPFIRLGRAIRYLKSDLDAWLAANRVTFGGCNGDKGGDK